MARSILSRYLDPEALARISGRRLEPRGLVYGNLAGSHRSPLSGFAVEFMGHREYVPGDEPKHIDWRVYFNRRRVVVKQYAMETNFVCHLLLDVSASMRYGDGSANKLDYASKLACALAHTIIRQSDKASLGLLDDGIRGYVPPNNSFAQIVRMTEALDNVAPQGKTDLGAAVREIAARFGRREIVMLFSDCFTDVKSLEEALQQLRYNRHEVVVFHILHHDERTFPFEGMVKFVGLEQADELLTRPEDLRRAYLKALDAYLETLDEICRRNRVELVPVDTAENMGETLADYLSRREQIPHAR
ncbi:DUF58 domain-containing protein [Thermostilla marina]